MKKIAKYVADDGSEFTSERKCREYEAHCKRVAQILKPLGPLPNLPACGFANGDGYIQHDEQTFMKARVELLEQAKKFTTHKWIQESIDKGMDAHSSYAARIIQECTTTALDRAWCRIQCVDRQFREWGQPYYAEHPEKAKQVKLR